MRIRLKHGLDIELAGAPEQQILQAPAIDSVALLGCDYPQLRPKLAVAEGDEVKPGQTLFTDRRKREIRFTATVPGRVESISRGARRSLERMTIAVTGAPEPAFEAHSATTLEALDASDVRQRLLESGLWPSIRTRPYSRVPDANALPSALFVTAIDTNPLAVEPELVISSFAADFENGLVILSRLVDVDVFVCMAADSTCPVPAIDALKRVEFDGPHPAGLPGTHIHRLATVHTDAEAWYVGYQDVIAIGKLFTTGEIWSERVVAIGGPGTTRPRIVPAPIGADLRQLLGDDCHAGNIVISGSVLSGRRVGPIDHYLGRYDLQTSVLPSAASDLGRWPSGMLPLDAFDRLWPLQAPVGALLRALLAEDTRTAESLGCLALDAEDFALCSYACPSGCDYGSALKSTLAAIEKGI